MYSTYQTTQIVTSPKLEPLSMRTQNFTQKQNKKNTKIR